MRSCKDIGIFGHVDWMNLTSAAPRLGGSPSDSADLAWYVYIVYGSISLGAERSIMCGSDIPQVEKLSLAVLKFWRGGQASLVLHCTDVSMRASMI